VVLRAHRSGRATLPALGAAVALLAGACRGDGGDRPPGSGRARVGLGGWGRTSGRAVGSRRPLGNSDAVDTTAPPYPPHWDFDVVLADGGTVHIRPILPSDAEAYLRFFSRLSPETRYHRFFSAKSSLSDDEVRHDTTVDFVHRTALIAMAGEEIVAVARYDVLDDGHGAGVGSGAGRDDRVLEAPDAEVAFTIDDEHQGRGLGTLMLEYLAAAGRENGVGRFVAETMPDNRRMIAVFHDAGYQTVDRFADGLVMVEFPIAATEAARDAVERREHRAEARSIERILNPKTVAVVGASSEPGAIGHRLFLNLLAGGFSGPVYPVNPNAAHVASVPAYATIGDVPGEVDLAVIATPAEAVPDVVEQCTEKGVKGLVVISSGFREAGPEGVELEGRLLDAARRGGMRVVGPNCMGVANTASGLNATFVPRRPLAGRVGLQSESGAVGMALLDWATRRGLGISSFASVGDKVDVSSNDLLQYWEDDPGTDLVLLYLESFGNPRKFARIARRVAKKKPIVAVKSGRVARLAPPSGPSASVTADVAVDALFRQAGVIRVDTLSELFDVAQVLADQPLPAGDRVAVVSNARGPALLAADAVVGAGLQLAELGADTRARLHELLGPHAAVRGPVELDITADGESYRAVVEAVVADDAADAVHVVFTPPLAGDVEEVARGIAAGAVGDKPVVVTYLSAEEPPRALTAPDLERRLPTFDSPEPAARALARVAHHAAWRRRDPGEVPEPEDVDEARARRVVHDVLGRSPDGRALDPAEVAALLGAYGVAAPTAGEAPTGATPVDGVEVCVGLVQDPAFGPLVTFGIGGMAGELRADTSFRILPLTDRDAAELVRSVRASPVLFGHDGAPPVAVDLLEDLLVRVGLLAGDLPEVASLSLAPVHATPGGLVVGGAEVTVAPVVPGAPELVRRLRT
jgi:acyl-CoA synthetase (NDP forming)/RimJ/RimL family protein N-acetyltransferase